MNLDALRTCEAQQVVKCIVDEVLPRIVRDLGPDPLFHVVHALTLTPL